MVKIGLRGSVIRNPEQRAEQRRQILLAAGKVFARKGYAAAKMDDIAAEMGGSKGILYYQFKSKQDVIVETRREASGSAADKLQEIVARPLPVLERLELAMRHLIGTTFEELARHVILTPVTIGLDKEHMAAVREVERRYEALLIALLEEGMRKGVIVPCNAKVMAFTMIRTAMSPASWFHEDGEASKEQTIEIVTGMLMRSVAADASERHPRVATSRRREK